MNEQQEAAVREYDSASREIQKALPTNNGGKRAETNYAAAYQKLVVAGLAPQLKRKYRA